METIKMKKCSVKLNRLSFIGVHPDVIQEQILDQRVRKCSVRLQRCNEASKVHVRPIITCVGGQQLRHCIIRLPRLNLVRSELSSPAVSVVSSNLLSDQEDVTNTQNRTNEWVQRIVSWN